MALDSPKVGRLIRTITSLRVDPNSPQAITNVWDSMLYLEIKNSKSRGLLLMMRVFHRFRAFLMPTETIAS